MLSSHAQAQITVTTAADENNTPAGTQISLREALRDSANGGTISFSAALNGKVLVLTAGEMEITEKTLTVNAPGGFVIEARGLSRIFNVAAGAGLNLTGLTLQGGAAPADGGAILNAGTLNLTNCLLRDNRAANGAQGATGATHFCGPAPAGDTGNTGGGGGAVSNTGSLMALRCQFTGNAAGMGGTGGRGGDGDDNGGRCSAPDGPGGTGGAGGSGGAVLSVGSLTLMECIFESNSAGAGGAGGVPVNSNFADGGNGGRSGNGGAVSQAGGMNMEKCSFVGNGCPPGGDEGDGHYDGNLGGSGSGSAVFWSTGTATLTNCTFSGNRTGESVAPSPSVEHGGTIAAGAGTVLRLIHCTVAGNLAARVYSRTQGAYPWYTPWVTSTAAGIVSAAPVQCENCIISGNLRNRTGTSAAPVWEEINFSPNTPRTVIPFGPLGGSSGVNAQLHALALTTGSLPVLVPGATSTALNTGAIISSPPATDQRGLPRAAGIPDLGAVEVQPMEATPRVMQSIAFAPPPSIQAASVILSATSSSGLPVSFELVSGPATLNGTTLTFTLPGFAAVRAVQPGDTATAPALAVVRVIAATHFIRFVPAENYTVYALNPAIITLPATTFAGLPVTWSFADTPGAGATLTGNQITAVSAGSLQIRGQNPGNAQYAPVDTTWTLTFVQGALWWDTPSAPFGGPYWFTLVEGSPHGLSMTARIAAPHSGPVPVPVPAGLTATPSVIPAGQTSVECLLTLPANASLTNQTQVVPTGNPTPLPITLFLAHRRNVPLDVFAPLHVLAGTSIQVDVTCPGVPAPGTYGPPPDLAVRSVTVAAFDYDNPAIPIPVTLDSTTTGTGPYPHKNLRITFAPMNRRARLTVTTDDGITGSSGPIIIHADTNADRDGINDIVEAALQRAPDQFHPPPLVIESDGTGLRAVLGKTPLNPLGWTIGIELSTDLQTWTPAPAGSTTRTPNPDGISERVAVLLPAGSRQYFARLKVVMP